MRQDDAGFTLLEILVVTIVFGLLSVALWEGVGIGTRGWALEEHRYGRELEFQGLEDSLHRLIERAELSDPGNPGAFSGQADLLRLISWLPEGNGFDHEIEAGLGVSGRHELVLRWRHYRRAKCPGDDASFHEEVLAHGVRAASFSYYGMQNGRHVWQSVWSGQYLPLLVKIKIDFTASRDEWPEMLIRPLRSGADGS
ncbi:prepilin-type N-terminal cleavage/methylation domain-containing protein [Acetobacter fallax]|uniref:Prepilin-type N-terminal cleavage/methylation domain-containing protein n=1 Tax=Acetobacter fallax TaxID=1737473 RepID=A0ABX0KCN6_9PROT|nr:prepilin-type N-terminal cleavage/methylation domain-containing protein [Acetobacter fallax]NHO32816.1 prepilin-type N-terminal cleavage/methylation domain-containing protein [Acetobacter fallax]NHO36400.1 prepilin-type N-terminal cleavage/methylation domain-containing protein [Acetobacter fallax]